MLLYIFLMTKAIFLYVATRPSLQRFVWVVLMSLLSKCFETQVTQNLTNYFILWIWVISGIFETFLAQAIH